MTQGRFVTEDTLIEALRRLPGTAGQMLRIWLVLKHMGLAPGQPVTIDTQNSLQSGLRLFGALPEGRWFYPLGHTPKGRVSEADSPRSIIQTNIKKWHDGTVTQTDPRSYLTITQTEQGGYRVAPGASYPRGLGYGHHGLAAGDDQRVAIPDIPFAVWYGRETEIPADADPRSFLLGRLRDELNLSDEELELLFVHDPLEVRTQDTPIPPDRIHALCEEMIAPPTTAETSTLLVEQPDQYRRRLESIVPHADRPAWLRTNPEHDLKRLLARGERAILIYGPPRTGKTRAVDAVVPRTSTDRATVQIHDGWSYDHLVEGLHPDEHGQWSWRPGPLLVALNDGKRFIILEEINRTDFTQAIGEVFSLIEPSYRGPDNAIPLRSGRSLSIPEETTFVLTMNTVDRSTEELDDALLGRVAAVRCPPDPLAARSLLRDNGVPSGLVDPIVGLFVEINEHYELGHGYLSGLHGPLSPSDVLDYYRTRIRPVLEKFLGDLEDDTLRTLDQRAHDLLGDDVDGA